MKKMRTTRWANLDWLDGFIKLILTGLIHGQISDKANMTK
jgi:hypothetical protein